MWNPFKNKGESAKAALPSGEYERYQGTGACDVCNESLTPGAAFLVPTRVFWDSKKYRRWLADNPVTKSMLQMAGVTVMQHIAMQKKMDQSEYSAVCPKCIHLFK